MICAQDCFVIFQKSIHDYHQDDNVDAPINNPFPVNSFEALLYAKNWIDTVQWHLEDLVRAPMIDPARGIEIKRRIDKSNQERTDVVERLDDYFLAYFKPVIFKPGTRINSETPAWLLDRMSILMLKIFHMKEQTERRDVSRDHVTMCESKLSILSEQKADMQLAYDELIEDISNGLRRFKIYRQMKMYNDKSLNPMLYGKQGS